MSGPASWPLVGREMELRRIRSAGADRRPAVVLSGPSGVGKSRLAREVLTRMESDGARVAWVQATRTATGLALGAFAALIPHEVRSDDPFELMQRAALAVRDRGGGRPIVLGVDDAQWLDPTSATLVLHLATTGAAFVVATVRSHEPCPDAVVALWKDAGADRIEVGLLTEGETNGLAQQIAGGPIDRSTLHWVWTTSRGNALYVRELVMGALAGGALQSVNGLWRLPEKSPVSASLSELVSARLAGLSPAEQDAMDLLALGEPLRLAEMLTLVGEPALTAVENRGLIGLGGVSAAADVRLAHPLYGEVIRPAIRPLRARAVRLRLAQTIQARTSADPEDPLRLARWLIDAGDTISTDLALRAARAANLAGDADFGATLAEQALSGVGLIEAALLLARAHTVRSRFAEAERVLAAAEPHIDGQDSALQYLEQQSEVLHWGLRRPTELRELLDRAALWWTDPGWQQRIEPLRLRVASFQRLGLDLAPATEILHDTGADAQIRERVGPVYVGNLFYSGRTQQAVDLGRSIRPTLPLRTLSEAIALSLWCRICLETGEHWAELDREMTAILTDAIRLADHAAAGQAAYCLACLRQCAGRYLDAAALLAEADLQLHYYDPVGLLPVVAAMAVELAVLGENEAAIEPGLQQIRDRTADTEPLAHQMPYVVRAHAWAAYSRGDRRGAQRLLLAAADELSHSPVHGARMTYEAIRVGANPRSLAGNLNKHRARCDAPLVVAYADHAAAYAHDDGAGLIRVSEDLQQIGATRYALEAAAHAADAFARQGRDDSARRAAVRARDLHTIGNGAPAPFITLIGNHATTLTTRERQITQLAARGLTNVDIAEQLVLSTRTVESHLYRAMQKLGLNDRHDLPT